MATKEQQVHKMADPALLDKIDKLFACNVGEHIDLPQLVVVGDQSSGKSSVLEGLTELPFPRDSGLCTRFATQITFRRAPEKAIRVSVIPSASADQAHVDKVKAWHVDVQKLDAHAFAKIMSEVPGVMGLSTNKTDKTSNPTFSSDVLRLEIHGPEEAHLSVIDVPGIFKNTTPGLTTKQDIAMVREIVLSYMKNPRSVMIAVVPANVDIATQEILEMAREVDPEGQRTIGVFTKPDLVDKGAEAHIIDLLQGRRANGKLGWSMVRNLGQQELKDPKTNRQSLEENFFRFKEPWNKIDKDRVGVSALFKRLQKTLTAHIRREFPKVKLEINKKLFTCKDDLKHLGPNRETLDEQRKFLLDIAAEFQHITSLALAAQYGGQLCFKKQVSLRLPTRLANRSESFNKDLALYGHEYVFLAGSKSHLVTKLNAGNNYVEWKDGANSDDEGNLTERPNSSAAVRKLQDHADLEDILHTHELVSLPSTSSIIKWLEKTYVESRGNHLGTFNPAVLSMMMDAQSGKWEALALGYTSDVIAIVHDYVVCLLTYLCPDETVRSRLLAFLLESLLEHYRKGLNEARFLLDIERKSSPQTVNHYFNENLEKSRQKRREQALSSKIRLDSSLGRVVPFDDLMKAESPMSNTEHTVREMHDILCAYYKVARKRFVDNMVMQAAEYYLVSGPDSPLKLFRPTFVAELTEEQLEEIAGEEIGLKRMRRQLKKEISDLEAGKRILM